MRKKKEKVLKEWVILRRIKELREMDNKIRELKKKLEEKNG